MIGEAKNPVIVAGGGVSQGDALHEVTALAEFLSAPVVNTYLHNDSFPYAHELGCGPLGYCGSKAGTCGGHPWSFIPGGPNERIVAARHGMIPRVLGPEG